MRKMRNISHTTLYEVVHISIGKFKMPFMPASYCLSWVHVEHFKVNCIVFNEILRVILSQLIHGFNLIFFSILNSCVN